MKLTSVFIWVMLAGVFLFYLLEGHQKNPMIGTWQMKSGVYYTPDSGVRIPSIASVREMKIINGTHFTTIWQDTVSDQNMGFNGGAYSYNSGIYAEYLEYFSIKGRIGDTAYFKVDLNGDLLNISACDEFGNISETGYFQEWERVK